MVRKRVFNDKGQQASQCGDDADSADERKITKTKASRVGQGKVYALSALLIVGIIVAAVVYHLYGNHTHVRDVTKKAELPLASTPNAYDEVGLCRCEE